MYNQLKLSFFHINMLIVIVIIFLVSVNINKAVAETEESLVKVVPATLNQLKDLAEAVCAELLNYESQPRREHTCRTKFLNHRPTKYVASQIDIKCRANGKITLQVAPSKYMQLITILNDGDVNMPISYVIVDAYKNEATLYPQSDNYTIWTTILNETGATTSWKRGPRVQNIITHKQHQQFDINIIFSEPYRVNNKFFVNANFNWNPNDAMDTLTVTNTCNKKTQGDVFYKYITQCEEHKFFINNLFLDDKCTMELNGTYGFTKKTYLTPPCDLPECISSIHNVTLAASWDDNQELWLVRVSWSKPIRAPTYYNITLRTNILQLSILVNGNESSAVLENVRGQGSYNVSVVAHAGNLTSHTSVLDNFPEQEQISSSFGLVIGVWIAAVIIVLAVIVVPFYWKRHLKLINKNHYYRSTMEKITQDLRESDLPEVGVEDQWEVRPERLLMHEVIGEGAFGVVRRGTFTPTNKEVAVKMLKDFPTTDEIRSFRAEMELMKSVGAHAHVVSLLACCSGRRPLIVAEYCGRGDLLSYLRCSWEIMLSRRNAKYYNNNKESVDYRNDLFKNKSRGVKFASNKLYDLQGVCDTELTVLDLLSFCRQIAIGMEFLASNRVIHRDLAARNVLVTSDRTLKIADFGLSRDIYEDNQYRQKGNGKMPVKWMALESLTHRIYTTKSDVWSFGVVVWEVVTVGGAPYAGVSAARLPRLLAAGYRMPRPPNCSAALYEVMVSCWGERPQTRPSFPQLHAALDALLCASADHYLSLAVHADVPEPQSAPYRYVRMLLRGKRKRSKSYERPLAANHYTDQPHTTADHSSYTHA